MKNFIQSGVNLTLPAPAAVLSGEVVIVGGIVGVAAGDASIGADVDLTTEGVFDLPKVAANEFAVGAVVYWNSTTKLATTTASGNTKIGHAVAAAGNPSASVPVKLVPIV